MLIDQFKAARSAGTPLIAIRTPDPAQTIRTIKDAFSDPPPIAHWDIIGGYRHVNKPGEDALAEHGLNSKLVMPIPALQAATKLPTRSILFFANAHRIIKEQGVSQAIWNLRDVFKENRRSLVMLCPDIELPLELRNDVTLLDEPLPDFAQLETIVRRIYKSTELPDPDAETLSKATDAICGLSAYPAEQATAESVEFENGAPVRINLQSMWERKRRAIEEIRGLSVWRGGSTFADMRGCENAIRFLRMTMLGKDSPRVVLWVDEIEKQLAGFGTDTSGSKTGIVGQLLTWMANTYAKGILLIGPPGSGKSMLAQCCGASFDKPTISLNMGLVEGSLVGESAGNMNQALKVIDAVGQGSVLVIGTCNSYGTMPPEMRRRFKDATFFVDLPEDNELASLWDLYVNKYGVPKQHATIPESKGWTGAEVRNCCDMAYRFGVPLKDAAPYIVPVCRSAALEIAQLRQQAHNTFISASRSGVFQLSEARKESVAMAIESGTGRKLKFDN